jgi:4-amino-4-deoxy-L-arabinose transferase-like glycosyltransferase
VTAVEAPAETNRCPSASPRPAPPIPGRSRKRSRGLTDMGLWIPVAVAALTVVVRILDVARAYDINSDEVNYTDLSISLQHGTFPPTFQGAPFVLHPPAFFAIGGSWLGTLGIHGSYFNEVFGLRYLNVVFAAISAVLIYFLGVRMVGRSVGAGAAVLFAFDPYILRQNGRAMLETSTLAFVLAGYLLLLMLVESRTRHRRATAIAAGVLLGVGIVDKDMAAILVLAPLVVIAWKDFGIDRRLAVTALVAALVPYAIYVAALTAQGDLSFFVSQETLGLRRQLGLVQGTGFNAPGSPSLFSVARNQLVHYWVTYLISALGVVSSLYLLVRSDRPVLRIWSLVTLAGAISLVYAVLFGTIEEQMLYFMYVPALLALMATVVILARARYVERPKANHRLRRAVAWGVLLFAVYDLGVWVSVRSTQNDGLQRVTKWFAANAPHPGVIANDTEVTMLLLQRSGFAATQISTPETAAAEHVRYLTILSASLVGNYGSLNPAQAAFFAHYGRLVYQYRESTYGTISIYQTINPAVW